MKAVIDILEERLSAAMDAVTGRVGCAAIVKAAVEARFGDYQANGVMQLAKSMGMNPRKLAADVVAAAKVGDICEEPEIAGPGFINLRLKPDFVAKCLLEIFADRNNRLAISSIDSPQKVVVDFSGPNIAKQMHVGHLRSTIIGDCICRVLEFQGHNVIRQNHIGDWGTQFGKVILGLWHICMAEKRKNTYYIEDLNRLQEHGNPEDREKVYEICKEIRDRHEQDWKDDIDGKKYFCKFLSSLKQRDINEIWPKILNAYRFVNLLDDCLYGSGLTIPLKDEREIEYEALSRYVTVMLQQGGDENQQEKNAWDFIKEITMQHCAETYSYLNVTLKHPQHTRGESFYSDKLQGIVDDLKAKGLAEESEGAVCVFPEGFKNKEGKALPFIIQKSDGAFLYATTDLAALRYRLKELGANRIVYITDARQKLHFEMLFAVGKMAGWVDEGVELSHVMFGSVLGEDGKPFKTRSGENVKLKDLLDEAVRRAKTVVEEKNPELGEEKKNEVAHAVGIGAVKYADYSNNRTSDYVFSFERMLAMEGNTAPYMQYAYARIKSIERKAQSRDVDIETELSQLGQLSLSEPEETALAKHLLCYGQIIAAAAADYRPNFLTGYLYDLAQKFSVFYTNCPVLKAPTDKKGTRLLLCDLTARTIRHGLSELLGIAVVEQM